MNPMARRSRDTAGGRAGLFGAQCPQEPSGVLQVVLKGSGDGGAGWRGLDARNSKSPHWRRAEPDSPHCVGKQQLFGKPVGCDRMG